MSYDERNIFAQILSGKIPAERIFENEHALAFRDINPQAPTHVVVVPKGQFSSFQEFGSQASPEEIVDFVRALAEVPNLVGVAGSGFRLICNAGDDAQPGFQAEVPHFHAHLLGGRSLGPLLAPLEVRAGVTAVPQVKEDDATLLLLPTSAEATPEQVEAVSQGLDLVAYEAQRLFPCQLPRALCSGGLAEVERLRLQLEAVGLGVIRVGSSQLLADVDPWLVDRVRVEEGALILIGAEGEHRVTSSDRGLLVRGRYVWTVSGFETSRLSGFGAERRRGSSTKIAKAKRTQFAHLYLDGVERPFSCLEDKMVDYSFLGDEMTASAHTNFDKLIDALAAGEGISIDDSLLTHAMLVKMIGRTLYEGVERPVTTSPDLDADLLSRLVYVLWASAHEEPTRS